MALEGDTERERERFLAALGSGRGDAEPAWSAPIEASQGHHLALLAARRLKDISVYLLFFAFLLLTLAVGLGAALGVWGKLPGIWGPFAFVAGAFVGVLSFLFFKFMSDTVRALADLSDLARSLEVRVGHMSELLEQHADTLQERV
ncbi:MAG: hypothetical protein AB7N76_35580 [Planctomycetota bacterium]